MLDRILPLHMAKKGSFLIRPGSLLQILAHTLMKCTYSLFLSNPFSPHPCVLAYSKSWEKVLRMKEASPEEFAATMARRNAAVKRYRLRKKEGRKEHTENYLCSEDGPLPCQAVKGPQLTPPPSTNKMRKIMVETPLSSFGDDGYELVASSITDMEIHPVHSDDNHQPPSITDMEIHPVRSDDNHQPPSPLPSSSTEIPPLHFDGNQLPPLPSNAGKIVQLIFHAI